MFTATCHASVENCFGAFATLTSPLQFFLAYVSLRGACSGLLTLFSNSCSLLLAVYVIIPQLIVSKTVLVSYTLL